MKITPTKQCATCKALLGEECFSFWYTKQDGQRVRNKSCKPCLSNRAKQSYNHDKHGVITRADAYRRNNPEKYQFSALKSRAKKNGLEVGLTFETFRSIKADGRCFYCGGGLPVYGWGIDRVDSEKGYTLQNCVACCHNCNIMKNKSAQQDFLNKIVTIYKYLKLGDINDNTND